MLSSYFYHLRRLVCDQSPPVHPATESRGGCLSVTDKQTDKQNPCVLYWITMETEMLKGHATEIVPLVISPRTQFQFEWPIFEPMPERVA